MFIMTCHHNSHHFLKVHFKKKILYGNPIFGQIDYQQILEYSNHFRNILRLFKVLPNFPFTTTETMPDYYL